MLPADRQQPEQEARVIAERTFGDHCKGMTVDAVTLEGMRQAVEGVIRAERRAAEAQAAGLREKAERMEKALIGWLVGHGHPDYSCGCATCRLFRAALTEKEERRG